MTIDTHTSSRSASAPALVAPSRMGGRGEGDTTSTTDCIEEGCERPVQSRGYCNTHYKARWRGGEFTVPVVRVVLKGTIPCSVEGCEHMADRPLVGLCEMHYGRVRRTGEAGEAQPRQRTFNTDICEVEGCDSARDRGAMCRKHGTRVRRHGDPHAVTLGGRAGYKPGVPSYETMHQRVRAERGRASDHPCVDCGTVEGKREWSYNHRDENEVVAAYVYSKNGRTYYIPYSIDSAFYESRCPLDHRRFDRAYLRAERGESHV